MSIISVDLPWKEGKRGRRTLAIADLDGNVKIAQASDDNELLELVCESAEPESIILLDIPIDGCDNLDDKHFRPIDKAIAHQTLPALPASKAASRGKGLKALLEKDKKRVRVYEIYPYAIYKFLAYLKREELLQRLNLDKFDTLLDEGFRIYWPPKYKRESKRDKRLGNVECLYSLLTDTNIGLNFQVPLHRPDTSCTLSELNRLCDEYDACLGAIVGIYFANYSSYACVAGDSNSGNMLLLADRWLSEQLSREVRVCHSEKRG